LSPFPFPWSNGFFGTIQTVGFWKFMLATAISLLKLVIHTFIGSRFGKLTGDMDPTSRTINYVSLTLSFIILIIAAWYIYKKMNSSVEKVSAKRAMDESAINLSEIGSSDLLVRPGDELVVDETGEHGKIQK
jgi:hypothetical protein